MIGRTLELRYEDPRVCDTWIGMVVGHLSPAWIVQVLVLSDPLDEFGGEAVILSTERKLEEWVVEKWG